MANKENIIDNIKEYSPYEIVNLLESQEITIQDILDGNPQDFDARIRSEVENKLWENVCNEKSEKFVRIYLDNYPYGIHKTNAQQMLNDLLREKEELEFEKERDSQINFPENDPWHSVNKNSIEEVADFLRTHGTNPYCREARALYNDLRREQQLPRGKKWLKSEIASGSKAGDALGLVVSDALNTQRISLNELISLIEEDHNFLPLRALEYLIEENQITTLDLDGIGIDPNFLKVLDGNKLDLIDTLINTEDMVNPEKINQTCQEIYFWGMPSSGKTCALGAILSAASTGKIAKTIEKNTNCCGYDYMRQLSQIFQPNKVSILPTGTDANFVSDMSFWLQDDKKKMHSLTLIDIAGEMLAAMYHINKGLSVEALDQDQIRGYKCIKNLLVDKQSKNSKIHFFVLEYGGHERMEHNLRQVDMLDGALSHIKNLGILKNTDAVYILLTKADKALKEEGDLEEILSNYVKTHYQAFYNNLKLNTKQVNGGKIEVIPFSIGEVCFQNLCRFDDETANDIVSMFLEITVGKRIGKIGNLINIAQG